MHQPLALAAMLLAALTLAACGGSGGDGFSRPPALVTIKYGELPAGINGEARPGVITVSDVFAGNEVQTLDALSVLLVHELWHAFVSLDHLEEGCYASPFLSVTWGDMACAEEQRRWFNDVPPGDYPLEVVDAGLLTPTQRAASFITQVTLGGVTFTVQPVP